MTKPRRSTLALPLLALAMASGSCHAGDPATAPQNPGDVAQRAGHDAVEKARLGSDDKKRWAYVVMESGTSEKDADRLSMPLVAAARFEMRLDPRPGHLIFTKPGMKQVFQLSNPAGSAGDPCPQYNVRVLDASERHVVFQKICLPFAYRRSVQQSNDFFLYDVASATVRTLWRVDIDSKGAPFPEAVPAIKVAVTPTGYRFDWSGMQPADNGAERLDIKHVYKREKRGTSSILSCSDAKFPGKEGMEPELCNVGTLKLVSKMPQ